MKSSGVKVVSFPKSDIQMGREVRSKVVKNLTGKLFSKKALEKAETFLDWTKK